MSLASLNQSGIQSTQPALYQTIQELIATNESLQRQLTALGLTPGGNQGLDSERNTFNLLGGQIKFPVTANLSIDPNILDDYREINAPAFSYVDGSGAGLAITTQATSVIKIGSLVIIGSRVTWPVNANAAAALLTNLPFTVESANGINIWAGCIGYNEFGVGIFTLAVGGSKSVTFFNLSGVQFTNSSFSGHIIIFTTIYRTAE